MTTTMTDAARRRLLHETVFACRKAAKRILEREFPSDLLVEITTIFTKATSLTQSTDDVMFEIANKLASLAHSRPELFVDNRDLQIAAIDRLVDVGQLARDTLAVAREVAA